MRGGLPWLLVAGAACALQATGPIALDDSAATAIDRPVEVAVLLNDRAPTDRPLAVEVIRPPLGDLEMIGQGVFRYQPPSGFEGFDTFDYSASTEEGSATATVTVMVGNPPTTTTTTPPTSTTATSTTATSTTTGSEVQIDPDPVDFGERFVGVTASQEVRVVGAAGADIDLEPVSSGDIAFDPGQCRRVAAGDTCTATVTWTPSTIGSVEPGSIALPGIKTLALEGMARHALLADPSPVSIAFETSVRTTSAEFVVRNIADAAVEIALVDSVDLGTVRVDTEPPDGRPCPGALLSPGDDCVVRAFVEQSDARPGDITSGTIRVLYARAAVEVPVTITALPPPPDLARPQPGQTIWWELLERGITVRWEPVDGASSYRSEGEVCFGDSCQEIASTEGQATETRLALGNDAPQYAARWEAAQEEGLVTTLRLRITALATSEAGQVESRSEWVPFDLVDIAFDVVGFAIDPAPRSNLCSNREVDIHVETDLASNLLDDTDVVLRMEAGDQPTGTTDRASLTPDPGPHTLVFDVASQEFDEFVLELSDGSSPQSVFADYDYEVCVD